MWTETILWAVLLCDCMDGIVKYIIRLMEKKIQEKQPTDPVD